MGNWLYPTKNPKTTPPATRLRLQTSQQGLVRSIVWGRTRIAGNLIDYLDFQSHTQSQSGGKGGSTSGGGKGQSSTQTTYSVTVMFSLCEGPIGDVTAVWFNKGFHASKLGFTLFNGSYSQTAWGYLTTAHATHALNYRGLAYMAEANLNIGNSAELPQLNFEVTATVANAYSVTASNTLPDIIKNVYNLTGYPPLQQGSQQMSVTFAVPDANPRDVVVDFLTNTHYGVGWPSARLDAVMNDYSSACLALGLVISPALVEAKDGNAFLQEIADATHAGFRWSNGLLTIVPWFDTAIVSGSLSNLTETHVIPHPTTSVQPTVQVGLGGFVSNTQVQRSGGGVIMTNVGYTKAGKTLSTNQYYVSPSGLYTFSIADILVSVDISYVNAAQASFQPDNTPIYDISDFLPNQGGSASGDHPISAVHKPAYYQYNSVKLEWLDRNNNYDPSILEVKDQAAIDTFILRARDLKQTHMFCLGASATMSATLQLQRERIPNLYTFTVGPQFILLEVEDIVTLTRPVMGLNQQPVRIIEIQENDTDTLTITAEEYMGTVGPPLYSAQFATGAIANYNADPGNINNPWIFEPPAGFTNGALEIWGAVSGINVGVWGGCHVWASYDGVNFAEIGTIIGPARMGVTTLDLPAVTRNPAANSLTIDSVNTLAIDLTESGGTVISASATDMTNFNTKCWVGSGVGLPMPGEIIAYETAALTATNKYNLTILNRGGFTSTIIDHPVGSPFLRMDTGCFSLSYNQERIGATIFFKFQSFNVWGGGLQDLSTIGMESYVIQGPSITSPLPNPTNLRVMFTANVTQLWWDEVSDFRNPIYELRKGPSWDSGLRIIRQAHPPYVVAGDDTYWVSAFTIINNTLVYSATPPSIIVSTSILAKNVFSFNEQTAVGWSGTLTNMTKVGTDPNAVLQLNQPSASGSYEIPASHMIDIGYVANNLIGVTFTAIGTPVGQNILTMTDILNNPDILGAANTANVTAILQIAVSQDGVNFGSYQNFNSGVYPGRKYKFRILISNNDVVNTTAFINSMSYSVDVPTRVDHYSGFATVAAGSTVTFAPDGQSTAAFNSGINGATTPLLNFTSTGLSPGDTIAVSPLTLGSGVITVSNGGVGVIRTLRFTAEGY